MYNVVLIGCGLMGERHLQDIYTMENVCVYGVCDLDIEKARIIARKYNAKSFSDSYIYSLIFVNLSFIHLPCMFFAGHAQLSFAAFSFLGITSHTLSYCI